MIQPFTRAHLRAICALMSDNPFSDPNTPIDPEARLKRLTFRAWRRGFKEADLIMGRFADTKLYALSADEVDEFERLLDAPDTEVYGWICGTIETPPNFDGPVLNALKAFDFEALADQGDGPSS